MGMIHISIKGSFQPNEEKKFFAVENGHASAIAEAIKWLAGVVLQKAIRRDHDLHERGVKPSGPFGKVE